MRRCGDHEQRQLFKVVFFLKRKGKWGESRWQNWDQKKIFRIKEKKRWDLKNKTTCLSSACSPDQWFSNLYVSEGLWENKLLGPVPRVSNSVSWRETQEVLFQANSQEMMDAASPGTTLCGTPRLCPAHNVNTTTQYDSEHLANWTE